MFYPLIFILLFVLNLTSTSDIKGSQTKSSTPDNPSSVSSVSNFIKTFHLKNIQKHFDDHPFAILNHPNEGIENEKAGQRENLTVPNKTPPKDEQSSNVTESEKNVTSFFKCLDKLQPSLTVEILNSTRANEVLFVDPNVTNRLIPGECVVILFYSNMCPFSCFAAPHFNVLPRAFPTIKMAAINAMTYQCFNTQYGIAGVPTIIFFHNGRPAAKFNDSEYTLELFSKFITKYTGIKPVEKVYVTSSDFGGPVPSVLTKQTDYVLGLAWLVIFLAVGAGISKSRRWRNLVETVQNAWREAQATHEHTE